MGTEDNTRVLSKKKHSQTQSSKKGTLSRSGTGKKTHDSGHKRKEANDQGEPKQKQHKFVSFYEALEAGKINPFARFLTSGTVEEELGAEDAGVADVDLETENGAQTFVITSSGLTIASGDLYKGSDDVAERSQGVSALHRRLFGEPEEVAVKKDELKVDILPETLKTTYAARTLVELSHRYRTGRWANFSTEVKPLIANLPSLLRQQNVVLKLTANLLKDDITRMSADELRAAVSFCMSVVRDFGTSLPIQFVVAVMGALKEHLGRGKQRGDATLLVVVFESIASLLQSCRHAISMNFREFVTAYFELFLCHPKHYVRQFAGEGISYILRPLPLDESETAKTDENTVLSLAQALRIMHETALSLSESAQNSISKPHDDESDVEDQEPPSDADDDENGDGVDGDGVDGQAIDIEAKTTGKHEKLLQMYDVLSIVSFELTKSVENSLITKKADFVLNLWLEINAVVAEIVFVRMKAHVAKWETEGSKFLTALAVGAGEEHRARLMYLMLAERPRLYGLFVNKTEEINSEGVRILEGLAQILLKTPLTQRLFYLLGLERGLPPKVFDEWISSNTSILPSKSELLAACQDREVRRLYLTFARGVVAPMKDEDDVLPIEERHVAMSIFTEKISAEFKHAVEVADLMVKSFDSRKFANDKDLFFLGAQHCSRSQENFSMRKQWVGVPSGAAESAQKLGDILTLTEPLDILKAWKLVSTRADVYNPEKVTSAVLQTCVAKSGTKFLSDLGLTCRVASPTQAHAPYFLMFLRQNLEKGKISPEFISLRADLQDFLISCLASTSQSTIFSALVLLEAVFAPILEVSAEFDDDLTSPAKKRRLETDPKRIFAMMKELIVCANTLDTAHFKSEQIGRVCLSIVRLSRDKSVEKGVQRLVRLCGILTVCSQLSVSFSILWKPAVEGMKVIARDTTDDRVLSYVFELATTRLHDYFHTRHVHESTFVIGKNEKRLGNKVDASIFLKGVESLEVEQGKSLHAVIFQQQMASHLIDIDLSDANDRDLLAIVHGPKHVNATSALKNASSAFNGILEILTPAEKVAPKFKFGNKGVLDAICSIIAENIATYFKGKTIEHLKIRASGMTEAISWLKTISPSCATKASAETRALLMDVAADCEHTLLKTSQGNLQATVIQALAALAKGNARADGSSPWPGYEVIARYASLRPDTESQMIELCSVGAKQFKRALRFFSNLLTEDVTDEKLMQEKELMQDLLLVVCVDKMSEHKKAVVYTFSNFDEKRRALLLSHMLSGVFNSENLNRAKIIDVLSQGLWDNTFVYDVDTGFYKANSNSERSQWLQLCTHVDEPRAVRVKSLKRLTGCLTLLPMVLSQFRHKMANLLPVILPVLASVYKWVVQQVELGQKHAIANEESLSSDTIRHLNRNTLKTILHIAGLYASTCRQELTSLLFLQIRETLIAESRRLLTGQTALVKTAYLFFVTRILTSRDLVFIADEIPELFESLLSGMRSSFALQAVESSAIVDEGLRTIRGLWKIAYPHKSAVGSERQRAYEKAMREEEKRERNAGFTSSSESSDEEMEESQQKSNSEQTSESKQQLGWEVDQQLREISMDEVDMAQMCSQKLLEKFSDDLLTTFIGLLSKKDGNVTQQELYLVMDLTTLPSISNAKNCTRLLALLVSMVPRRPKPTDTRSEKICTACINLLPHLRVFQPTEATLFRRSGDEVQEVASGESFVRTAVPQLHKLLTVLVDSNGRAAVGELILGLVLCYRKPEMSVAEEIEACRSGTEAISKLCKSEVTLLDHYSQRYDGDRDLVAARLLQALTSLSAKDFSAQGDPDAQVAIFSALVEEKDCDPFFVEVITNVAVFLNFQEKLDLGVQTLLSRLWSIVFRRLGRVGCARSLILAHSKWANRVDDKAQWETEWQQAATVFLPIISDVLIPHCNSKLRAQHPTSGRIALAFFLKILTWVTPVCGFLPGNRKIPGSIFADADLPSLKGTAWLMEDLLSLHEAHILAYPSADACMGDGEEEAVRTVSVVPVERSVSEYLDKCEWQKISEGENAGLMASLEGLQKAGRAVAFRTFREQLKTMSRWTISHVICPLSMLETLQLESSSNESHHGGLSEESLMCLINGLKLCPWTDFIGWMSYLARLLKARPRLQTNKETLVHRTICRLTSVAKTFFDKADADTTKYTTSLKATVLPLLKSIVQNKDSVRPEAVSALLQATSLLPQAEFKQRLPPLIHLLAKALTDKELGKRKDARVALRFYVQTLGLSCLPDLLKELHSRAKGDTALASLMLALSGIVQTTLPLNAAGRKLSEQEVFALSDSVPLIFQMVVEELDRVTSASDLTEDIETERARKLNATRKKKQAPETTRVEAPFVVERIAVYLSHAALATKMIPSIVSLLNPSNVVKKSADINTSAFNRKYLNRVTQILKAAISGIATSRVLDLTSRTRLLTALIGLSIALVVEQGQAKEIKTTDFPSCNTRSLQEWLSVCEDKQLTTAMIQAFGTATVREMQAPAASRSSLEVRRAALYAVQPGAPSGTSAAAHTRQNKRAYETSMQGQLVGEACFRVLSTDVLHMWETAAEDSLDAQLLKQVAEFSVDAFVSTMGTWKVNAGQLLVRLQRMLVNCNAEKRERFYAPCMSVLQSNAQNVLKQVVTSFAEAPARPSIDQAKQVVSACDTLRFYLNSTQQAIKHGDIKHGDNKDGDNKRETDWLRGHDVVVNGQDLRAALISYVSQVVSQTFHQPGNQMVRRAVLNVFVDVLKHVHRFTKADSNRLIEYGFSSAEIEQIYAVADDLISVLVQHAAVGRSFGQTEGETKLVQASRCALVTFFVCFPLKDEAFEERIDKLLAQLSFEEKEGRRSVMNTLAFLVRDLPDEKVGSHVVIPLWLKGVSCLHKEVRGSTEYSMLKKLLYLLLDRVEPHTVSRLLTLSATELREDMPALLAATSTVFEHWACSDFATTSQAEITRALQWTTGAFHLAKYETVPSAVLPGYTLATQQGDELERKKIRGSMADVARAIFTSESKRMLTWLSSKSEDRKQAQGSGNKNMWFPCLVGLLTNLCENSVDYALFADIAHSALQHSPVRSALDTVWAKTVDDWKQITTLTPSEVSDGDRAGYALREKVSVRLREDFVDPKRTDVMSLYLQGLGDACMALVALSSM